MFENRRNGMAFHQLGSMGIWPSNRAWGGVGQIMGKVSPG